MSLLSWLREKLENVWYGRYNRYPRSDTYAAKPVTPDGSLELSAWWGCVKLYAEAAGTIPLKFYERLPDGSKEPRREHPVAELIGLEPNEYQTTQEFWGAHASALCMHGNAYAEKQFMADRLVALQPLPFDMWPYRRDDDELYYRFPGRPKSDELPADKVFHTKGFSFGGDRGLSPLEYARQTLSIAAATEQATGSTFAQGLRLSGFFTGPLSSKEQRDTFRSTYIDPITGNDTKAHYGILPPSFDFKTINIAPKDAEMLMSRRFNVEDICRFMRVPPILIGHAAEGQTMWGTGVEQITLSWLVLGLDAFLSNIEKSINKRLLSLKDRRRFFAEFDRNALLRADSVGRAEMYSKLFQVGGITANQICDKENVPRFVGGDIRFVNSTYIPYASAGKKPPPTDGGVAPPAAPPPGGNVP